MQRRPTAGRRPPFPWRPAGLALCCTLTATLLAAAEPRATRDRPPAGHSGGFGEPTCQACHDDAAADTGAGRLAVSGVPDRWEPGRTYLLTVRLSHPGMRAAGFQLTVRFEDGSQAGSLRPGPDEERRVGLIVDRDIQYAHQLYDGGDPAGDGKGRWTLTWQAPADSGRVVVLHAAAVAANDDLSPLGDFVHTATRVIR
jgi:hypothetical protein